jgi:F-type H+-transporting ATPase subunit delta
LRSSKVARRYARALLGLSAESSQLEAWGAEVRELARMVEAPELAVSFAAPDISQLAKIEALEKTAERLGLSYPVRSFAAVMARHGRIEDLPAVAEAYRRMLDDLMRRTRATLTFAASPDDRELAGVVSSLEAIAQKRVIPTINVDESLIGGVVVELEGRTYDGSLASRLAEAARRLAG